MSAAESLAVTSLAKKRRCQLEAVRFLSHWCKAGIVLDDRGEREGEGEGEGECSVDAKKALFDVFHNKEVMQFFIKSLFVIKANQN